MPLETEIKLDNPGPSPVLTTKLYAPPPRPDLVSRTRLIDQLDQGLQFGCKLTLISAPAGFGKTTIVTDWLHQANRDITWLSLDADDNDPNRFLTYLVAALQKLDKAIGQNLLQLSQLPPAETLVTQLINDMASISKTFALVLDDYHMIKTPLIHEIVEFLVKRQPPQMHLVITSREDPPLPLSRLRVRGQIVEIRQEDLRFLPYETSAFLNQSMGLSLNDTAVQLLDTRTEGWIAGLQLAALSLQGRKDEHIDDFINDFSGSHRYVIDYLVEEVIQQQPVEIRQFLTHTAILDRLSAPLCNAVTGREDSKTIFNQLEHANLFLIPLDEHRAWYRYHHLFADFLRTEAGTSQHAVLHQKASYWFESNGFITEAIKHALAANQIEKAGQLIIKAADGLLHNGELITLNTWFTAMPDNYIRADVELATYKGWLSFLMGNIVDTASFAAAAEAVLPADAPPVVQGKLMSLQACIALSREATGIELAQKALTLLDKADTFFKGLTLLVLGEGQSLLGDTAGAVNTFEQALRLGKHHNDQLMMVGAAVNLAEQLNWQGKRNQAAALCQQIITQCVDSRSQPLPYVGLAYVTLGQMVYWANHITEAYDFVEQGITLSKQQGLLGMIVSSHLVLAPIQAARGQVQQALETIQELYQIVIDGDFESYAPIMAALEADLQLKTGNSTAANQWAATLDLPDMETASSLDELVCIIYARVLLQQHRLEDAAYVLSLAEQSAQTSGRLLLEMITNVVQVGVLVQMKQMAEALARLEKVVRWAEPEEYRRVFLNEGAAITQLLPQVRPIAPDFIDSILADGTANDEKPTRPLKIPTVLQSVRAEQPLIEPLSKRELEILYLVANGQSNREIAEHIYVTVGTVKKHLSNIFGKMSVKNRTQAAARARDLGLVE